MKHDNDKQSEPQQEELKYMPKFSQEQYEMLKLCSEKGDMTEWNVWRQEHPNEEVHLENANLIGADLCGADLGQAMLYKADLTRANLTHANLEEANLGMANLQQAYFNETYMALAHLHLANLQKADLLGANLQEANLTEANLSGASLSITSMLGTCFHMAIVNGGTLIAPELFDRFTDFTGVGLNNARIEPRIRQLFEYNIRRLSWENWYVGEEQWRLNILGRLDLLKMPSDHKL